MRNKPGGLPYFNILDRSDEREAILYVVDPRRCCGGDGYENHRLVREERVIRVVLQKPTATYGPRAGIHLRFGINNCDLHELGIGAAVDVPPGVFLFRYKHVHVKGTVSYHPGQQPAYNLRQMTEHQPLPHVLHPPE